MARDSNIRAFEPECQHCKRPRNSLGTSIPDRVKAYPHVPYLWCTRCDRV